MAVFRLVRCFHSIDIIVCSSAPFYQDMSTPASPESRLAMPISRCNIQCWMRIDHQLIFNVSLSHTWDNDPSFPALEQTNLAKYVYITEILFGLGITVIKLSILWFYHLLFSVDRTLQLAIRATAVACLLWCFTATLAIVFQCTPPQAYWEEFPKPKRCLRYPQILLGCEMTNLFIDVAVLCIPARAVWNLNLTTSKKVPIIAISIRSRVSMWSVGAMGLSNVLSRVCIFSILRIKAIWNPPDVALNFDFGNTYTYSILQLGLAIVTSCLPTLGPLLVFVTKQISHIRSWYQSLLLSASHFLNSFKGRPTAPGPISDDRPWLRVGGQRHIAGSETWTHGENGEAGEFRLREMPSKTILVSRDIEVV
ncbi:hypothetical protein F5Y17DRAFT_419447 [Xylariaceae sp. FL0594]|nr:hypothetical protein F5Y17DRAFT_419447 [Xylariaceae sp. FL0594]